MDQQRYGVNDTQPWHILFRRGNRWLVSETYTQVDQVVRRLLDMPDLATIMVRHAPSGRVGSAASFLTAIEAYGVERMTEEVREVIPQIIVDLEREEAQALWRMFDEGPPLYHMSIMVTDEGVAVKFDHLSWSRSMGTVRKL